MPDISDERVREIEERVEMALDEWGEYRHLPVAIDGYEHLPAVTIEDVLSLARRVLALEEDEQKRWRRDFTGREFSVPTNARAVEDLRWYAERLCADKPWRYEVYQARGEETRLSDSIRVVLAALTAAESQRDAAVAIAREWDADFQRFAAAGCDVAAVKDRRAKLATLTGEG